MRLLDLFCKAGGAAMGYHRAGFDEIVGIDIEPQKRYPFEFVQCDALEYVRDHWMEFDAIHASPPCQAYVKGLNKVNQARGRIGNHKDLVPATRAALERTCLPWVIENVVGAPLRSPIMLCGSSFGLPIFRHRLFESNVFLFSRRCEHWRFVEPKFYTSCSMNKNQLSRVCQVYGRPSNEKQAKWPAAMGIDWMIGPELSQAIPPAYTEHIGRQLLDHIRFKAS